MKPLRASIFPTQCLIEHAIWTCDNSSTLQVDEKQTQNSDLEFGVRCSKTSFYKFTQFNLFMKSMSSFWKHLFWKTSQPKCVPFKFKFYFSKFWNVFVRNNYFVFNSFFSHWYEVTFKFAYTPRRACKLTKPRYNYTSARTNTKFNTNPTPHTTKASSFSNQSTILIKLLIKNNFTTRCGFSITRHKARTTSTM